MTAVPVSRRDLLEQRVDAREALLRAFLDALLHGRVSLLDRLARSGRATTSRRTRGKWGICGGSAGANCAPTLAWLRSDRFRRVISLLRSFARMEGGDPFAPLIQTTPRKPLPDLPPGSDTRPELQRARGQLVQHEPARGGQPRGARVRPPSRAGRRGSQPEPRRPRRRAPAGCPPLALASVTVQPGDGKRTCMWFSWFGYGMTTSRGPRRSVA